MQGNEVLATARQAVAGMGSLFGSASKRLDWIGSSIDRKAQELIQTATSPSGRDPGKEFFSAASPEVPGKESMQKNAQGSGPKMLQHDANTSLSDWGWDSGIQDMTIGNQGR